MTLIWRVSCSSWRDSIDGFHDLAAGIGTRVIHCCGFDSIPSDLGVLLLRKAALAEDAGELEDTTLVVSAFKEAGLGKLSSSKASMIWRELRERYRAFCVRSLAKVKLMVVYGGKSQVVVNSFDVARFHLLLHAGSSRRSNRTASPTCQEVRGFFFANIEWITEMADRARPQRMISTVSLHETVDSATWRKYTDQINLELILVSLSDAKLKAGLVSPTPTPSTRPPREIRSSEAACLASRTGSRVGPSSTPVTSSSASRAHSSKRDASAAGIEFGNADTDLHRCPGCVKPLLPEPSRTVRAS